MGRHQSGYIAPAFSGSQSGESPKVAPMGARGLSGAFGACGILRPLPLITSCRPKAPEGGGGGSNEERLHNPYRFRVTRARRNQKGLHNANVIPFPKAGRNQK